MIQTISTLSIWSDDQSKAVALVIGEGLSQEEAAAIMGMIQQDVSRLLLSAYEDARVIAEDGFEVIFEIPIFSA